MSGEEIQYLVLLFVALCFIVHIVNKSRKKDWSKRNCLKNHPGTSAKVRNPF